MYVIMYDYFSENVEVEIDSTLGHVKGDSGDHFKLMSPNYKYKIQSTTFDLKNLFNGNKQLGKRLYCHLILLCVL